MRLVLQKKIVIILEFNMSFEDTSSLPGVPSGVVNDLEDVNKAPIEVQAEVHVDATKSNDNNTSDNHVNSNGTEIDPLVSEEKDVIPPLSKQISKESMGNVPSVGSGNSMTYSAPRSGDDSFVVQMTQGRDGSVKTPPSSRYSRRAQIKKRPSMLQRLSLRESQLSPQESWRKKSSTTRIKNHKNYISYHNITYSVPQGWFFQHKPPKVILNNIRSISKHMLAYVSIHMYIVFNYVLPQRKYIATCV